MNSHVVNVESEDQLIENNTSDRLRHAPVSSDADKQTKQKLTITCVLYFLFFIFEVVYGYQIGSVSAISDAVHLLSDFLAILIALGACLLSKRQATEKKSFGFHRAEVICALLSIIAIWVLTGFLISEGIHKINNPSPIKTIDLLIFSVVGLIFNIFTAIYLNHGHSCNHGQKNVNVNAALLHILGDILCSCGLLIASLVLFFYPEWIIIDPICAFVFAAILFLATLKLFRRVIHILMEGTPEGLDISKIESQLKEIKNVQGIHDLHVWTLTPGKAAIVVHLVAKEGTDANDHEEILSCAQHLFCKTYDLHHATIQIERQKPNLDAHCISSVCNGGSCSGQTEPQSSLQPKGKEVFAEIDTENNVY